MSKYNVVMETSNSTVVAEYEPLKRKSDSYQSEAALEQEFIRMLTEQGYDYLEIHEQDTLVKNLRNQLELLNNYKFSDSEWERFFNNNIANNNDGIVEKTRKIQEDHIQVLKKDDGTSKNIYLLDKLDFICNDMFTGLPAEIEARQMQYEYYRDKLLTFKELVNEG